MSLPRLQLFEFNDSEATPESLRDTVIETLSRVLDEARSAVALCSAVLKEALFRAVA